MAWQYAITEILIEVSCEYEPLSNIEMILLLVNLKNEYVLLVVIYRSGPYQTFIRDFTRRFTVQCFPTQYRILIVRNFNLDQMLPTKVRFF